MKQTVKTSRAAGQLEKMFRVLNQHYFEGKLPEPIISLKKNTVCLRPHHLRQGLAGGRGKQVRDQYFIGHPEPPH